MLLRRITQHVKDQNWFAVAIDFAIVVFGVFIGIQVANWNEYNGDRKEERLILERLQDQLSLAEIRTNAIEDFDIFDLAALSSAREVLFGVSARKTLTPEECNSVAVSNIHLNFADSIPILQELESSGKLGLIENQSIITALANYSNAAKAEAEIIIEFRTFRVELTTQFPDLLTAELTPDQSSQYFEEVGAYDRTFKCDVEKMLTDREFLNAFGINASHSLGVFELGTLPKNKALQDLKAAVDSALGVSTSESN